MSGLSASSFMRGPALEKSASWSELSTAPTVSAASAAPGAPMVDGSGPLLPAAMTKSAPVSARQLVDGLAQRVVLGVPGADAQAHADHLGALVRAAHSMPAMIPESLPAAVVVEDLADHRSAPGATPFSLPPEAAPVPAMVEATWVPCPLRSMMSSPGTKLRDADDAVREVRVGRCRRRCPGRRPYALPVPPAAQPRGRRSARWCRRGSPSPCRRATPCPRRPRRRGSRCRRTAPVDDVPAGWRVRTGEGRPEVGGLRPAGADRLATDGGQLQCGLRARQGGAGPAVAPHPARG